MRLQGPEMCRQQKVLIDDKNVNSSLFFGTRSRKYAVIIAKLNMQPDILCVYASNTNK